MIAAARRGRCIVLNPEDMQHGMTVGGRLRIINPFRER
jgi:predicted nucleic acid-binding protein